VKRSVLPIATVVSLLLVVAFAEWWLGSYTHLSRVMCVDGQPYFQDLAVLLHGLDVFRSGASPYELPESPFNYPPAWRVLAIFGVFSYSNLLFIGVAQMVAFYGFSIWYLARLGCSPVLAALALVSPATLLLLERGNCDLLIYLLLGLGALYVPTARGRLGVIFATSMLKVFPAGALCEWVYGLRGGLWMNRWRLLFVGLLFAVGFGLQLDGLLSVSDRTPRPVHYMSYGLGSLPRLISQRSGMDSAEALLLQAGFYAFLILTGFVAWRYLARYPFRLPESTTASARLFLVGAGCFIASNLIGFNWEYRLVFLLFTLPELCAYRTNHRNFFLVTCCSIFVLLYQTMIKHVLDVVLQWLPYKTNHFYVIADLVNILLFFLLLFVVIRMVTGAVSKNS
jgi:hypothetical protein